MSKLYEYLPECPKTTSAANILVRMIDSAANRYRWGVEGLDDSINDFRPSEGSMNGRELLEHMYILAEWMYQSFIDTGYKKPKAETRTEIIENTLIILKEIRDYLMDKTDDEIAGIKINNTWSDEEIPFWYLINGPIADILTHVGQITSWRRMMGNPIYKANLFRGTPPKEK